MKPILPKYPISDFLKKGGVFTIHIYFSLYINFIGNDRKRLYINQGNDNSTEICILVKSYYSEITITWDS